MTTITIATVLHTESHLAHYERLQKESLPYSRQKQDFDMASEQW